MASHQPTGEHQIGSSVSIRRALVVSFSALIAVLALTILLFALVDRRQARAEISRSLVEQANARAHAELSQLFGPIRHQLAVDRRRVRLGGLPQYDVGAYARHSLPTILELPMVGSMMVADTAGYQLLFMAYDSAVIRSPLLEGQTSLPVPSATRREFFTREFRPTLRGDRSIWQLWDSVASRTVRRWEVSLPEYDPTKRPWFTHALGDYRQREARRLSGAATAEPAGANNGAAADPMAPAVAWSDVYTLFTTREAGISASFAERDPSGRLVIVAYDVVLDEISRFTLAQLPTPNARVFVVSDSGDVIGLPQEERFSDRAVRDEMTLQPIERLDEPHLGAWAAAWRARSTNGASTFLLDVDGARWWGGVRPFLLDPGHRFWIGVVIPEADVQASIGPLGGGILAATVIGLLLAFLLAGRLARRVADPLYELAEQSARISRMDLAPIDAPDSKLTEVRRLSAAISRMRSALEEGFFERARAAKALAESESKLLQSQKLEAVGQLAGGVAHDFNNLLTAVRGYAELLREHLAEDQVALDDLSEIETAAERASDLTKQLLSFSRRQHVEAKPIDVNETVASAAKMLGRLVGEHITLETRLEPGIPAVSMDPSQLHQVLVNLAVNSRDAMPEGGRLVITTTVGGRLPAPESLPPGLAVEPRFPPVIISVVDDGKGMSLEVQARAFEPFFTTKEMGRGTGLGLATCWGILRDAGGVLELDSAPGNGTVVRLIIPSVEGPALGKRSETGASLRSRVGETILVVEDDGQLRRLAERTLEGAGFQVVSASDGVAALELLRGRSETVNLVVTDVVMPRMSGPALARRVHAEWPGVRVLFMTGYAESDAFGEDAMPPSVAEILRKPFAPDQLLHAVRSAIDDSREH